MNKSILITAIVALSAFAFEASYAQPASVTQTLNLAVNAVYKISVSGVSVSLTITDGTAGTDGLTSVSDASTTYSMTQNSSTAAKITANLNAALPQDFALSINLESSKGTSCGTVDISNTTPVNVVTGTANGADNNKRITYTFSALASAGMLASTTRVVTLTISSN